MAISPGQLPQFGPERSGGTCVYNLTVRLGLDLNPVQLHVELYS